MKYVTSGTVTAAIILLAAQHGYSIAWMEYADRNIHMYEYPSWNAVYVNPVLITNIERQNIHYSYFSLYNDRKDVSQLGYSRRFGWAYLGINIIKAGNSLGGNMPPLINNLFAFTYGHKIGIHAKYLQTLSLGASLNLSQQNMYDLQGEMRTYSNLGFNAEILKGEQTELAAGMSFNHLAPLLLASDLPLPLIVDLFAHVSFIKKTCFISAAYNIYGDAWNYNLPVDSKKTYSSAKILRLGGVLKTLVLGYDLMDLARFSVKLKGDDSGWLGTSLSLIRIFWPDSRHVLRLNLDTGPDFLAGDNSGRGTCFILSIDYLTRDF
jgi:hypothetical protein